MIEDLKTLVEFAQHKSTCDLNKSAPVSVMVPVGICATTWAERQEFKSRLTCTCGLAALLARVEGNEGDLFRRLSDALTGGNASTWDEVIHAASARVEGAPPPLYSRADLASAAVHFAQVAISASAGETPALPRRTEDRG